MTDRSRQNPAEQPESNNSPKAISNNTRAKEKGKSSIASFTGPLPPPIVLERYENILPGSADRIVRMAEKQSMHRRDLENHVIKANIQSEKYGIASGFILALSIIAASTYLAAIGRPVEALIGFGSTLALYGYTYVKQKSYENKKTHQ